MIDLLFDLVKEEDLGYIYLLEKICFDEEAYPPQILAFYMNLSREGFVLVKDPYENKIIGYVIGILERGGEEGHVISICVDPLYRRRGIGAVLMRYIENYFIRKGACISKLEVKVSNTPAIELYKKLGYEIKDLLKNYYRDGSDAYIMIKNLCKKYRIRDYFGAFQ
ncbi:MAG: ribosomal protein S18-alanine N-acetyltransferase [Sulfolobales archaeon]